MFLRMSPPRQAPAAWGAYQRIEWRSDERRPCALRSDPMTRVGRYTLLEPIAQGGMAEIFRARADGSGGFAKEVAIKRVLPQFAADTSFIEQFLDEARVASRLQHPNIIQVFEFGEDQGTHYLAMEMLYGLDMGQVLGRMQRTDERMPLQLAAHITAEAATGLHHAHHLRGADGGLLGLVHRDVSPSNLFLTRFGGVKILDFGIAKTRDQMHKTMQGMIKGKYGYVPPEYLLGEDPTPLFDVWALGVTLHEMCTGQRLFKGGKRPGQALRKIAAGEIPSPRERRPEVPAELEAIVMGCLQREPLRRYPSAGALADELRGFVGGYPGSQTVREFVARWEKTAAGGEASEESKTPSSTSSASGSGAHLRAPAPSSPLHLAPADEDPERDTHDTIDSASGGITGTLEELSVAQIMEMMGMSPKRAHVEVRSDGTAGAIGFDSSGIVSATFGDAAGLEAAFTMLRISTGTFRIDYTSGPGPRNLSPGDASRIAGWLRALSQGEAPSSAGEDTQVGAPMPDDDDGDDDNDDDFDGSGPTMLELDATEVATSARTVDRTEVGLTVPDAGEEPEK